MRFFYNLFAYLLTLPFAVYWGIRAIANPTYRPGFPQRFGIGHPRLNKSIWVHAVSVGEVVAAEGHPEVDELRRRRERVDRVAGIAVAVAVGVGL